jgi:hypothetical protein
LKSEAKVVREKTADKDGDEEQIITEDVRRVKN